MTSRRTYKIYVCVDCGSGAEIDGTGFCVECSGDDWEKIEVVDVGALEGATALLEEVRKRSRRPFGGYAPYDLAVRIERFLNSGVHEPHPGRVEGR